MAINWGTLLPILISAGTGTAGAVLSSKAAGKASDAQLEALDRAAELNAGVSRDALAAQIAGQNAGIRASYPWLHAGTQALGMSSRGLGMTPPIGGYQAPGLSSLLLKPPASIGPNAKGSAGGLLAPGASVPGPSSTVGDLAKGAASGASLGMMAGAGLGGALGGATLGAGFGPVGMAAGAAIGGLSSLFGRGRKEADKIVPVQNELTNRIHQIESELGAKVGAGAATEEDWLQAISAVNSLKGEFFALADKFGRAGPGAKRTIGSWVDPLLGQWQNRQLRTPGRAHGGPVAGGQYIVGEQGPEVLEMAPGSKGYVHPNPSLARLLGIPGRANGGPVAGPRPDDVWKPWGEMSEAGRQWVLADAARNPAQYSMMTNPDGSVRGMTNDESDQYVSWQGAGITPDSRFTPSANLGQLAGQVDRWQAGGGGISTTAPTASRMLGIAPASGAPIPPAGPGAPLAVPGPGMPSTRWRNLPGNPVGGDRVYGRWGRPAAGTSAPQPSFSVPYSGGGNSAVAPDFSGPGGATAPWSPDLSQWSQKYKGGLDLNDQSLQQQIAASKFRPPLTGLTPEQQEYIQTYFPPGYIPDETELPWYKMPNEVKPGEFLEPWNKKFSFGASDLLNDPGYQFRLEEGKKAIERSAAARGTLMSGRTAKELERYGQGLAADEYADSYNRALNEFRQEYDIFNNNQSNRFNRLQALSGGGQVQANNLGSHAAVGAGSLANILGNQGGTAAELALQGGNVRASQFGNSPWLELLNQGGDLAQTISLLNLLKGTP